MTQRETAHRRRTARRRRGRDRGAAAVEMALITPVLLLVLCAIVDFGRMLNTQITLTEAAREGARAAAYGQSASARVGAVTTLSGVTTTVDSACGSGNEYAQVTVRVTFSYVTPLATLVGMATTKSLSSKGVMTCAV